MPIKSKQENGKHEENTNNGHFIVIAEDEEVNYLYLEALIEDELAENFGILHAKNGIEAVQMSMNPQVRLVLMDLKMPVLDGFSATKRIKEKRSDLIVIAQSAYATADERTKAMNAGCSDFLTKPINESMFKAVISKYVKLK